MILVTGATSALGLMLLPLLLDVMEGVRFCVGVRRPGRLPESIASRVQVVQMDLPARIQWPMAPRAIVHLAARTRGWRWGPMDRVNRLGTECLLDRARRDGVGHFLFFGTDLPPTSPYGRSKRAAEEAIRRSGVPFTILRPALVLGRESQALRNLQRLTLRPTVPLRHDLELRPLFVWDLAAVVAALLRSGPLNDTCSLAGAPVTLHEVLGALGGRPWYVPLPLETLAGGLARVPGLPVPPALASLLPRRARCPHEVPGLMVPTTPFLDGIRRLLSPEG